MHHPHVAAGWPAVRMIMRAVDPRGSYARRLPMLAGLGLAASLAEGLGVSLTILFFYLLLDRGAEAMAETSLLGAFFRAVGSWFGDSALLLLIVLFTVILARTAIGIGYGRMVARARHALNDRIRRALSEQYLGMSYGSFLRYEQGDLIEASVGQSWCVAESYAAVARMIVCIATAGVFGVFLVAASWQITLIAGGGFAVLYLAAHFLHSRARLFGEKVSEAQQNFADALVTVLASMRTLRVFGREGGARDRLDEASRAISRNYTGLDELQTYIAPLNELGMFLILSGIVAAARFGGLPFASSLAAVLLLLRLQPYLREFEQSRLRLASYGFAMRVVASALDVRDKIYDEPGHVGFEKLREGIRFEGVTLRYEASGRPSLAEVDAVIPAGQTTAIIGPSGAGKTTMVSLLLRLYRPDKGRILVDGVPLANVRVADWRAQVTVAGQDVGIVEGTLAENIAFGRAQISRAQVEEAANLAGLAEVIAGLPEGYETYVGEHGARLSAGQRQRLGLARALVTRPEILILDEALNAVETRLETSLRASVLAAMKGRTVVIVCHQLESREGIDHVIELVDGAIAIRPEGSEAIS